MDISLVIPSRNNKAFLERCLASIFAARNNVSFEVIVVNDSPGDGTAQMVGSDFPQVVLFERSEERGIGSARNLGMSRSTGRYIVQSDADVTFIEDYTLDKMADFMDAHRDVGILGPRVLYPNGDIQYACRRYTTVLPFLYRRTILGVLFPNSAVLRNYLMSDWSHDCVRDVEYLAAFYMIRREVFDQMGYMKNYRHGPEDQEYCLRAKRHKWRVVYYPEARVIHHYQRVSATNRRKALLQFSETLDFWKEVYAYKAGLLLKKLRGETIS